MSELGDETRTWSLKPQVTSNAEAGLETFSLASPTTASSGLVVRCTQCLQPFEITVDADLNKLPCPVCRRTISLTGMAPDSGRPAVISRIAHFELLERVGVGGFGTVWKARDTQLERVVALKIPRQGRLAADSIDEFMREARIAAKLTHPNIASIHEIGRDGSLTYVVTEFMPGMSLAHWADAHELTHREIAELGIKILNALQYAHEAGVVHRDLKPHNVLMDENGEPHITDFGLAKHGKLDFAKSRDGRILGTPAYISPEQASGAAHTADGRADIYSFGVMLFQLLTDTLPFQGTARVLINKALTEEPPRPSTLDSSIPADLETICLKCLEKSPQKRYPNAGFVADELRRFLTNEPIHARRISNAARFWRWCRRNPVIPVLFGSLVVVVLFVYISGWFLYETANRQAEKMLTRQSLRGIEFATESVASAATRELEGWYDLLEQLARSRRLRDALMELRTDESVRPIIEELNQQEVGEPRRNELRQLLLASPAHQQMQELLQDVHDRTAGVFGWFVLEGDGLQVARWPINDTVGVNYAWRTYFHGEDRDYPDVASYRSSPRRRLRETHLSAAFISQVTDRWVISVSTPVFGPAHEDGPGEFLGVIALLFELGQITNLPGEASASEFATLIETRADRAGAILQHPLYEKLRSPSRRLPDQLQQLRVDLDQWRAIPGSPVSTSDHYRDPVASDPLGTAFDHRWLAAKAPVFVRGDETGLWIVVQERYDQSIGNALSHLRSQARGVAVASMSLIIVLVIPLWAIALRRLR